MDRKFILNESGKKTIYKIEKKAENIINDNLYDFKSVKAADISEAKKGIKNLCNLDKKFSNAYSWHDAESKKYKTYIGTVDAEKYSDITKNKFVGPAITILDFFIPGAGLIKQATNIEGITKAAKELKTDIANIDIKILLFPEDTRFYHILLYKDRGYDKIIKESKLSSKDRKELDDKDFGIPDTRSFPLNDKAHVLAAIRMFNRVDPKYEKLLANKVLAAMDKYQINVDTIGDNNRLKKYIKPVNEAANNELDQIKKFNKILNKYKYGIIDNGKANFNPSDDDYYNKMKVMSPTQFEKYKVGVCWDYVVYEQYYMKKNFPDIKTEFYYIITKDKDGDTPTHAFMIFEYENKWYWFESSWKAKAGVKEFKNKDSALKYITSEHCKFNKGNKVWICKFDPSSTIGYGCQKYMDTMEPKLNEIFINEGVLNGTLYHGSGDYYKVLRATGPDLGNVFQKAGWSLFAWRNKEYAIGWAIFQVIKKINRQFNLNINISCSLSRTPILIDEELYKLINILPKCSTNLKTGYVYHIKMKPNYEYGLGHSSNTEECITIRTNEDIIPSKIEKIILSEDIIKKYCIITNKFDFELVSKRESGINKRKSTLLMTNDFMYNKNARKTIRNGMKNGEIEVGDDIEQYLSSKDIQIKHPTLKDRYFAEDFDEQYEKDYSTFINEGVLDNTYYHISCKKYSKLKPGLDFGNFFQDPGWALYVWKDIDSAIEFGICVSLVESFEKEINDRSLDFIGYKGKHTIMSQSSYEYIINKIDSVNQKDRTFFIHFIKGRPEYEYGLGHSSMVSCLTIRSDKDIPVYRVEKFILTKELLNKYLIVVSDEEFSSMFDKNGEVKKEWSSKNSRKSTLLMTNDYAYNKDARKKLFKALRDGELKRGDDVSKYMKDNDIEFYHPTLKDRYL